MSTVFTSNVTDCCSNFFSYDDIAINPWSTDKQIPNTLMNLNDMYECDLLTPKIKVMI